MFCQCGCGERTKLAPRTDTRKGWVKGAPMRYIAQHQRRKSPVEYIADPESGCWNWQRALYPNGYGQCWNGERMVMAHRLYYEREMGPIPEGLVIDHLCRNPRCVNPEHLEPVTQAENSRRGRKAKLTPEGVELIRVAAIEPDVIASLLGVSRCAVEHVLAGRRWA